MCDVSICKTEQKTQSSTRLGSLSRKAITHNLTCSVTLRSASLPSLPFSSFYFAWLRGAWHTLSFDRRTLNTACALHVSVCNYTEQAFLSKPCSKIKTCQSQGDVHDLFLSPALCGLSPYSHLHLKESNPPSFCHEMDRIRRSELSAVFEQCLLTRMTHMITADYFLSMSDMCFVSQKL